MEFPKLITDRLLLRPFVASDAAELFAIHSDEEAMRWFGSNPALCLEDAEKILQAFMTAPQQAIPGMRWAIVRQHDQRLLGSCGFFKWDRGWRNCQIGYELGRDAWQQGYMREALSAMLAWMFANLGLNRIEARVHPHNAASLKVLDKLGFVIEGQQREAGYWNNQYHPLVLLSLLAAEFSQSATETAALPQA
ncbi:GNAT family N-acetyltransferase [Silvimonas iriomotensis]|uniref:N-acetyltransferase YoaA n=1 Tax=Silvimonas iriomotensis TaxID=449662 RepID=A0ABQ2P505_9NEIS|nr:GNAT family protein [Silvimonas iriomotensis]GGP18505.1 putative N-acetyltransferase YoaA [Silvimonas iriomotensis]